MKKYLVLLLCSFLIILDSCASKSLKTEPVEMLAVTWSSTQGLEKPESATFDQKSQFLFVSNLSGSSTAKDGNGWIQKLDFSGKVIKEKWIKGLNAPKGIRITGDRLWVSDIDQMVEISVSKGKVLRKIKIEGATFLNDVAIVETSGGTPRILVSDMLNSKIWEIQNGKVSLFAEGTQLDHPNGLLVIGNDLYIASWGKPEADFSTKVPGRLLKMDLPTKKVTAISPAPLGNLDGLESDGGGGFWVSDWIAGKVYHIAQDGTAQLKVQGLKGAADLGINPMTGEIVVPCMGENTVKAFR